MLTDADPFATGAGAGGSGSTVSVGGGSAAGVVGGASGAGSVGAGSVGAGSVGGGASSTGGGACSWARIKPGSASDTARVQTLAPHTDRLIEGADRIADLKPVSIG
jgi:hypothetical protein